MNKKEYKHLRKAYKRCLNKLNKNTFEDPAILIDYFATYLKLIRDTYLLDELNAADLPKLTYLSTAIEEYEQYQKSGRKFIAGFQAFNSKEEQEAYFKECAKEKETHWTLFWELTRAHLASWIFDSIGIDFN